MRYYEIIFNEDASKAGIIKAEKPLTPAQQQHKQDKNLKIEKNVRDEKKASARKVADLRAGLT